MTTMRKAKKAVQAAIHPRNSNPFDPAAEEAATLAHHRYVRSLEPEDWIPDNLGNPNRNSLIHRCTPPARVLLEWAREARESALQTKNWYHLNTLNYCAHELERMADRQVI